MRLTERLLRFSIRNTLTLGLLSILWMGAAMWCYFSLPVALLPNLNFPTLSVIVENDGLTAEELEKQVALPVESAMSGIYNVKRVKSSSVANITLITIQLKWGADIELARQQILQKMDSIRSTLPSGSDVSIESLGNTLGQVQGFVLTGGESLAQLRDFAEYRFKPLLLQQDGVYEVLIFGGNVQTVEVYADPSKLVKFDLTLKDLQDALQRNNVSSAGGLLDLGSQSFAIVPEARLTDLKSVGDTIIKVENDIPVRIRDVGRVALGHLPTRGGAEHEMKPSVVLQIVKQPNADAVAVTKRIQSFVDQYKTSLPKGMTISKFYDQSELVIDSVRGVEEAVVLGAALVSVILLFFLGSWRAALVAFTSIPTALLSALVFMKYLGMSLDIMTLSAMAIATGMVIDDAIVVIENFFRHRVLSPKEPLGETFVRATMEVAGPVASSTITTVAIFAPLVFLTGLAGRLFSPVGVVVSIVMMASLVFAFTLIPSIGPHWIEKTTREPSWSFLSKGYLWLLERALRFKWWLVIGVTIICLLSGWILARLNQEFLPLLDEGSILMTVDTPPGSSLNETMRITHLLIQRVLKDPEIKTIVSTTGHAPGAQDTDTMNHSDVVARLVPPNERKKPIEELFSTFRERAKDFPGVIVDFTMPLQDKLNDAIGGVPATIGVKIYGDDLSTLQTEAGNLTGALSKVAGVVDLHPGAIAPVPSLQISLIPQKAEELGISRDDMNDAVEAMSYGIKTTAIRQLYKQVPLVLRYEGTNDEVPTLHVDSLKNIPIRTANGSFVPLSRVADIKFNSVPSRVDHEHATRVVTVSCNVEGVKNQSVISAITDYFKNHPLPSGYTYEIAGSYAAQKETSGSIVGIVIAALVLVGVILWMEFKSLRQMFLILLTIPLSSVGASLALWLTGQTLNVSSLIGLVMLMGVVLRNGIVLVDYIHQALVKGDPLEKAIKDGGRIRLRPILMTALSEILGLSPLALGIGSGSALGQPLAIAVIGGLIASTFLTLFVLPVGYQILYTGESRKNPSERDFL